MTKPICILTLPRSGSEVLQFHLSDGLGYPSLGEFLCFNNGDIKHAISIDKNQIIKLEISNFNSLNRIQQISFAKEEFLNRINLIKKLNYPIVVKAFICEDQFTFNFDVYERLFDEFQVIVLVRRDALKSILSRFICEHIGIWHPITQEELNIAEQKLDGLRFSIPEAQFVRAVKAYNELQVVYANASKFSSDAQRVIFEDFKSDPMQKINNIFGINSNNAAPHNTFISNHELYIENLDRIKQLYLKFSNALL